MEGGEEWEGKVDSGQVIVAFLQIKCPPMVPLLSRVSTQSKEQFLQTKATLKPLAPNFRWSHVHGRVRLCARWLVPRPTLPFPGCVTRARYLTFSKPYFPHMIVC